MKTGGFRAGSSSLNWAIVNHTTEGERVVIKDGTWTAPKTYDESETLTWIREKVISMVSEHGLKRAGIRYPETYGRAPRHKIGANARLRIEGVVVEALHANGVSVDTGALAAIASRLGSTSAKRYLERGEFRGLDLTKRPAERREAILAAFSALEKEDGN